MTKSRALLNCFLIFLSFGLCSKLYSSTSNLIVKNFIYGKSQSSRNLEAKIISRANVKSKFFILLTDGVHGNEYLGMVEHLINEILSKSNDFALNNYFDQGGVLIAVPQVNIDGVVGKTRYTMDGKDLNRSFHIDQSAESSIPEVSSLVNFVNNIIIDEKLKFLLALDYHCCANAIVKPRDNQQNLNYDIFHQNARENLGEKYYLANTEDVFGKFYSGTLKDFWAITYNIYSMTVEVETMRELQKLDSHFNFLSLSLNYLITPQTIVQN